MFNSLFRCRLLTWWPNSINIPPLYWPSASEKIGDYVLPRTYTDAQLTIQLKEERAAAEGFNNIIRHLATILASSATVAAFDLFTSPNRVDSTEENDYIKLVAGTVLVLVIVLSALCIFFCLTFYRTCGEKLLGSKLPEYSFVPNILVTVIICVLKALIPGFSVPIIKTLHEQLMPLGEICKQITLQYGLTMAAADGIALVLLKIFHFSWHKLYGDREGGEIISEETSLSNRAVFKTSRGPCAPIFLGNPKLAEVFKKASIFIVKELTPAMLPGLIIPSLIAFITGINWSALLESYMSAHNIEYVRIIPAFVFTFIGFFLLITPSYCSIASVKKLITKLVTAYKNRNLRSYQHMLEDYAASAAKNPNAVGPY